MAVFSSLGFMSLCVILLSLRFLFSGLLGLSISLFLLGSFYVLVSILHVVFRSLVTAGYAQRSG